MMSEHRDGKSRAVTDEPRGWNKLTLTLNVLTLNAPGTARQRAEALATVYQCGQAAMRDSAAAPSSGLAK
jgi:hypothetical protein